MFDSSVLTEGIRLLWLIPLAIGLLMLVRMFKGRAALSETEWRLFFGRPKDRVLTLGYWVRFYVTLLIAVALVIAGYTYQRLILANYTKLIAFENSARV